MKFKTILFLLAATVKAAPSLREAKFPATTLPDKKQRIVIRLQEGMAIADTGARQQKLSAFEPDAAAAQLSPLLLGDFNFDGHEDVAVLESIGYGGVNVFYRLWLWDNKVQQYQEFEHSISNPQLNGKRKSLLSGQRSGPRWYQTIYLAANGELEHYAEAAMLAAPAFWEVEFVAGRRSVVHQKWFDGNLEPVAETPAQFNSAQCLATQGSATQNPPQRVLLLDSRNEGTEVLARFRNGEEPRWISAECVDELPQRTLR
ncbi:MAG: hypothetical protein N2Z22_12010 [Turneriella sp.]|nr:hypothetical protein [Turneriella sp.]